MIQRAYYFGVACLLILWASNGLIAQNNNMLPIGKEGFIQSISIDPSIPVDSFIVEDDKFFATNWEEIDQTFHVENQIVLELSIDDAPIHLPTVQYEAEVKVEFWLAGDPPDGPACNTCTQEFILSVDYDADTKKQRVEKAFKLFEGAHKMKVVLKSHNVSTSYGSPKLYGVIQVDRNYPIDTNASPVNLAGVIENSQFLHLNWMEMEGAQEYDVEWTFYRQESEIGRLVEQQSTQTYNDFDFLFKNNATRVTVDAATPAYTINLLYPKGYIFYRVRGVKYDQDGLRTFGQWTSKTDGSFLTYLHKAAIDWHETAELNYQASVAFAEEGKNVPSVQYFDGSLRQRQSLVLSNSDERATVSQTIYDHHGRPAVQVMPAPAMDNRLEFKELFAVQATDMDTEQAIDTAFSKNDFDLGDCDFSAAPLSTEHGAGQYYSTNNPQSDQGKHQYIPEADGYAYSLTEYTPDLTGRIRRQSGVGETFKMGSGKETKYFYGKPNQKELDRLFGNEVGDFNHYLKNVVIDPNGQVSVSYIDAHGRTIATALAGEKPDNVSLLDEGYVKPLTCTVPILHNQQDGTFTLSSTHKLTTPSVADHTFTYALSEQHFQKVCEATSYCYDCLYDVEIRITDGACNEFNDGKAFVKTLANFSLANLMPTCASNQERVIDTEIFFENLPQGEYTITKKLSISEAALNKMTAQFMAENNCSPSLESLTTNFKSKVDTTTCQFDCDTPIEDIIGSEAAYIAQATALYLQEGFEEEIAASKAAADYKREEAILEERCKNYTTFDIIYLSMLTDVTPRGQYATYESTPDQITSSDPTSIFFSNQYQEVPANEYRDENGDISMVRNTAGIYVSPRELSPIEFITNWNPAWAKTLVQYFHPEYCLYQTLLMNENYQTSEKWNLSIEEMDTYQSKNNNLVLSDPYFDNPLHTDDIDRRDELINGLYEHGLWEFASYVIEQQYGKTIAIETATPAEKDILWQIYRDTYLAIKTQVLQERMIVIKDQLIDTEGNDCGCTPRISAAICENFDEIDTDGDGNSDFAKTYRFPTRQSQKFEEDQGEVASASQAAAAADNCQQQCVNAAEVWMRELIPCQVESLDAITRKALIDRLVAVCQSACDEQHPYGASTTPPTAPFEDSFVEIIKDFFPAANTPNSDCHPYLITTLNPYTIPDPYHADHNTSYSYYGPKIIQTVGDNCVCSQLIDLESCYNADNQGAASLEAYLSTFSEFSLKEAEIATLKISCAQVNTNEDIVFLPYPIHIPTYLECGGCYPCEVVTPLVENLATEYAIQDLGCNKRTDMDGLGTNKTYSIYETDGKIYVATGEGVSISTDDGIIFTNYPIGPEQKDNIVLDLFISNGVIYAATTSGVSISIDDGLTYTTNDDFGETFITGIYEANGVIYAVSGQGLYISTDGGITFEKKQIEDASLDIESDGLLVEGGIIYVGTKNGLFISDGSDTFLHTFVSRDIKEIYKSGEALYVGGENTGLHISTDGGRDFTTKTTNNGLASNTVFDVYEDNGVLYVATSQGLSFSTNNGESFQTITYNGESLGEVNGVYASEGVLYIATSTGAYICSLPSENIPIDFDFFEIAVHQLNYQLGFSFDAERYEAFYAACTDTENTTCEAAQVLCRDYPNIAVPDITPEESCVEELYRQAEINAINLYEELQQELKQDFQQEYLTACLDNLEEVFTATTISHEYHFTLYYYDQAGNLVQTVPPNGVKPLSPAETEQTALYREKNMGSAVYPAHTFLTQYRYNTLNQVTQQSSPDTEDKLFWYDDLGRLVFSQDGRQKPLNLYSYTIYDELGRIVEVGEKETVDSHEIIEDIIQHNFFGGDASYSDGPGANHFIDWINDDNRSSLSQITHTYYDDAPFAIPVFDNEEQDELRTRVASVTFEETADGDPSTYDYATHYSYDITGNVKTLVQEITALKPFDQNFKRIDYDYDYISGNVHAVYFQKGQPDQFTHRYEYDSNNRLIQVQSSLVETQAGGLLWDREAIYDYYLHGPLARMEIGDDGVQGCDYAYTLQGWIKGVNSNGLVASRDMGQDGIEGEDNAPNKAVARDALGYTLSYYQGDYQSISGNSFEMGTTASALSNTAKDLYNGNIRQMAIHNKALGKPIAYSYSYDQLHRIKEMTSVENSSLENFAWGPAGTNLSNYGMNASYDGNGNIQTLQRTGIRPDATESSLFNDLTYEYDLGNNKLIGTIDAAEQCEVERVIEQPINNSQTISTLESIKVTTTITGSEAVQLQTGQRICLEPGFQTTGIGGRFAAITGMPCEQDLDAQVGSYTYDGNGNMIKNGEDVAITWTPYGKVKTVTPPADSDLPTTTFGYDAAQNRILKQVERAGKITKTYYIRDAQGNMLSTYEVQQDTFRWQEQHLYGSSRLGVLSLQEPIEQTANEPLFVNKGQLRKGLKRYELSNHLGNVLAVVNDRKQPVPQSTLAYLAAYYEPTIVSASDYYPFGLEMPSRTLAETSYRFGFNGKEKDEDGEWGSSTHYDYGFRIYDPTIAKFLSVDPLTGSYPFYTPYQFAGNKPTKFIDLDGLEEAFHDIYGRNGTLFKWSDDTYIYSVAINSSQTAHYISENGSPFELFNTERGASGAFFGKTPLYMFNQEMAADHIPSGDLDKMAFFTGYFYISEDVNEGAVAAKVVRKGVSTLFKGFQKSRNLPKINDGNSKIGSRKTAGKSPINSKIGDDNCYDCFLEGDRYLAGADWMPARKNGRRPDGIDGFHINLRKDFDGFIERAEEVNLPGLIDRLVEAGNNSRGGVIIMSSDPKRGSHIINVVNRDGKISFYDFQQAADTLEDAVLSRSEYQQFFDNATLYFINTTSVTY